METTIHRTVDTLESDFDKLLAVGETISSGMFTQRCERYGREQHQANIMLRGAIAEGRIVVSQHRTLTLYRRSF